MGMNDDVTDRLPPHSIEAEQGLLGCVMLNPTEVLVECVTKLPAGGASFYDLKHQIIFKAIIRLWNAKDPIDLLSVFQILKDRGESDDVGGISYLAALQDQTPSAANWEHYLDIVHGKYVLRRVIATCTEIVSKAYSTPGEVSEFIDLSDAAFRKVVDEAQVITDATETASSLVDQVLVRIDELAKSSGKLTGVPTGFHDLDKMTGGMQPKSMIVIAGRTSMGKTSLAMNMAEHAAEKGYPVGVFSLEMPSEDLMLRMICSRAKVNSIHVRTGDCTTQEMVSIGKSSSQIKPLSIYMDDLRGMTVLQLRAKARRMAAKFGIKMFVIDYLQLLSSGVRHSSREQEVSYICKSIRDLAGELSVPIIVLAQLNREMDKDKKRKPRLSDLRESGSIEQDSDMVGIIYRPEEEDPGYPSAIVPANLLVAKHRNGATGDVNLLFMKQFTKFENAAKIDQSDIPAQKELIPPIPQ